MSNYNFMHFFFTSLNFRKNPIGSRTNNILFYLFLLFILSFSDLAAQTPLGFLDFGTSTSNTTATTLNTGFGGVRVGSAGGGFTIQNPGQTIGSSGELRGIAPTSASINSVGITSSEYGTASTTFTLSFEVQLSGGSSGVWSFFAGNGASFASAQTSAFTSAQVFASLRWTYGASNSITTEYRNNATWTTIGGTPFAQNIAYNVTIIGNNSSSTVNYGASNAYSVAANRFDLWINGVLVGNDLTKGAIGNSTNINAFRFYGESSTGNVAQITLDNIRWYNSCVLPATHLSFVNVPATGSSSSNLSSFTVEARSGSSNGPLANLFAGNVNLSKFNGTGNLTGTLSPAASAGVATYSNAQFDAAGLYSLLASANSPIYPDTSDNINVSGGGPCSPPTTQATTLGLISNSSTSIQASWTSGSGNGTLIVIRPTSQSKVDPSNGSAYIANSDFLLADQINSNNRVVYKGSGNSVSITGLNPQTSYTISAYEYNATGDCYLITGAESKSVYTLSTEPSSQVSILTATANSPTNIDLNFQAFSGISNTDGYLVLMKQGSAPTGLPNDSVFYAVSSSIGDATLARFILDPSAVTVSIDGLSPSTQYYFQLIPFNWDSINSSTINYLTTGTIITGFDTTFTISSPLLGNFNSSNVRNTTARITANVLSDGGSSILSRGVVWSLSSVNTNPVLGGLGCNSVSTTGTTGSFNLDLSGLPVNSLISYVVFATNAIGTTYSTVQTIQTLQVASQISFGTIPPINGIVGSVISPFSIELRRPDNTVDVEFTGSVTLVKTSGSGLMTGTLVVNAVDGVASFSNVRFLQADTYTFRVDVTGLTSITSAPIVVTASSINLAYQNFESILASPNWTYSGSGSITSLSNRFVGNASYQLTGSNSIVFDNIDISQYTNVSFSVAFAASGVDTDEDLFVDVSYNNGVTWTGAGSVQLIDGASNLSLNINTTNGARTPTGANPYVFSVPNGESQIRLRFRSGSDNPDANEFYFIDEVKVIGLYNSNPIVFRSQSSYTGFVSQGLNVPSAQQLLTINGNNIIDSVVVNASSDFEISTLGAGSFVPSNRLVFYPINGVLSSNNIYVRYNPSSLLNMNGALTIGTTNMTNINIPLSAELVNLSTGDIAFVGFDGVGPDDFSFVALKDIPENTRIWFTDKSWDGSLSTPAFTSAEASGVWTAPLGGITKGTVITMFTDPSPSVNIGSGTLVSGLSSVGEQLFAYQGSLSTPTFIAGFTSGNIINSGTPSISETWIPASLTLGLNFIKPAGSLMGSSFLTNASQINTLSAHRSNIHDSTKWTSSASSASFPNWSFKILAEEPTIAAGFQVSNAITNNSMTLNFSGGNSANCLIVMSTNSSITGLPVDGTSYTANAIFGSGEVLNSNEYVVYSGPVSNASVNITNLFSGTSYYFNVYSFNGTGNESNYLTSSFGNSNETTTGSSLSQNSDIVSNIAFVEPSLIDYKNYKESSNLNLSNSIELAKFSIRDGGGAGDADAMPTILSSLSIKITNYAAVKRLALYDGVNELAEISISDSIVVFNGLSFLVTDDAFADISLRASFQSIQTDLTQLQFSIFQVASDINGSRFSSSNAGAANTSTIGNRNRINVIASKFKFIQQPNGTLTGLALNPPPSVMAIDTFENRDIDFTSTIDISSNISAAVGSVLSLSAVQGLIEFANIAYSLPDTSIVLTASSTGFPSISSNKFDITYNPQPGDVYISEISYESTQEWIELYNNTNYPINIGNWYITDHSSYPATSEGDCVIPSGVILPAKSYVVVSTSGTGTQATDLTDIIGEILSLAGGRGSANRPTLNNSGDNLALYTSSSGGILMDGSLSVNFPDNSNSSSISIQRIANKAWDAEAFGRSTNVYASAIFTNTSPATSGSVALSSSTSISSIHSIPSSQSIDLSGFSLNINGNPSGNLLLKGSASSDLVLNGSTININFDQTVLGTSNRIRNLKVTGNLSILSNLLVSGLLDLDSGSIRLNGVSFTYSGSNILAGNQSIDASANNSNLIFSNSASINIPIAFLNDSIYNLTISGNGGILLNESIYISNQLLLNGGNITINNNSFIHVYNTSSNSIIRNAGYINGRVIRTVPASLMSNSNFVFPIGTNYYTPIELLNPQTNSGGNVNLIAYSLNSSSNGSAGIGMSSLNPNRYFYFDIIDGSSNFIGSALSIRDTGTLAGNGLALSNTINGAYHKLNQSAPTSGVYSTPVLNTFGYFNTGDTIAISTASLSLTAFLEGLYLGSNTMTSAPNNAEAADPALTGLTSATVADTILVQLHSSITYDSLFSWRGPISTLGVALASFPGSVNGNSYYIVIKHRNSLETWSANPVSFGSSSSYDFSTSSSQAYGDNMVDMGSGVYGIFTGDINQDGEVNSVDYTDLDPDQLSGVAFGYRLTDLNGDGEVNSVDYVQIDQNQLNSVYLLRP